MLTNLTQTSPRLLRRLILWLLTIIAMDMSAAQRLLARRAGRKTGPAQQLMDLPVMLATLSAQQASGFTARRVREEQGTNKAGDQPARMAEIFAPPATGRALPDRMTGAFNDIVASKLTMGADGEESIYSGV